MSAGVPDTTPGVLRGTVKLQVASPTINVPAGSSSEVTVNAGIRAQYYSGSRHHGSARTGPRRRARCLRRAHGAVRLGNKAAHFTVVRRCQNSVQRRARERTERRRREHARRADPKAPARRLDRASCDPTDFPFAAFKGLGSGSGQVIALPFQLSGAGAPASGVQPLTQSFIGSSGFAFAVSSEYVGASSISKRFVSGQQRQ